MGEFYFSPDTVCSLEARRLLLEPSHNHSAEAGRCGSLTSQDALWFLPHCPPAPLGAAAGEGYSKSSDSSVPAMLAHLGTRGSTSLAGVSLK